MRRFAAAALALLMSVHASFAQSTAPSADERAVLDQIARQRAAQNAPAAASAMAGTFEPTLKIDAPEEGNGNVVTSFRVNNDGGFYSRGFVRDVGNTAGCAAFQPVSGAGTYFMWHPCRGSLRFGRVLTGQTNWDDANQDDFTFAGGNQVTASGYGAFAYGDQVNVSSTVGVGFGSSISVPGTAAFAVGAQNLASGFASVAMGYGVKAGGQGSVAIGYRTTAKNDYSVAIGYRASNNGHTGTMAMGDQSVVDSVRNQADNEFRARYNGGFRLRVSTASNGDVPGSGGNVGCDLTVAVPTWTCASSRTLKHAYEDIDGEDVLRRIAATPVTTWEMIGDSLRIRHMGPVAEDFYDAFGLGLGRTAIGLGDIDGVSFAGVGALVRRTDGLRADAELLRAENDALRTTVSALSSQLDVLRGQHAALAARLDALAAQSDAERTALQQTLATLTSTVETLSAQVAALTARLPSN